MKKAIIFIGLKLLELVGVGLLGVGVWWFGHWDPMGLYDYTQILPPNFWEFMGVGAANLLCTVGLSLCLFLFGVLVYVWITSNSKWADKLSKQ